MSEEQPDDPVEVLRRWEDTGAVWRVLSRRDGEVTIGLFTCDGGEEVSRFVTDDPALATFVETRGD
ncbi:hypothetical protein [Nocardioides pacificus]